MCVTRFPLSRIKVVAVLILALVCVNVSLAEKVDADAAHRLASEFFSDPASRSVGKLSLAYTCPEDAAYYVFNAEAAEGGFVVVAGDDAVTPILGYSDVATFDPSNIPPALQWKLDSYKAEIAAAASKGIKGVASRSASPDKAPIAPLITTQWGQGEPYNKFCPKIDGMRCYTGCVATALAKILYYHRGSERCTSDYSYPWNNGLLSFDYKGTSFDWVNMKHRYDGVDYSETNVAAVAELMLACGVGVNMSYDPNASGSDVIFAKRVLVENFGYNPEISLRYKNNFNADEWNDTLYHELKSGRPILCQGGTHAYICDGYDGEGYFHYNWGWNGYADGFFLPQLLNPEEGNAFHTNGYILTGIQENQTDQIYWIPDLICKDGFRLGSEDMSIIQVWNPSAYPFKGLVGVKIISEIDETTVYHAFDWDVDIPETSMNGIFVYTKGDHQCVYLPKNIGLTTGKYKLSLSYHGEDNIWRELRCFTGCQDHILLEVTKENEYIYSNPPLSNEANYNIKVADVIINEPTEYAGTVYANEWFHVSLTYSNLSDVICRPNIFLHFYSNDEICAKFETSIILEGQVDYQFGFDVTETFEVGDYELDFYDEYGRRLNDETVCFSVIPRPDGSGIEAPEADGWDADAPVEYYDLQGRKVANPITGFYIARQGALTRKVFIR